MSSREIKRPTKRNVPLPFATFGELLAFGLDVHAWCTRCKAGRKVEIGVRQLRQPFAGARLRCQCGGYGHPSIRPPASHIPADDTIEYVDLYCGRCVPPWEVRYMRFDLPPWSDCRLARDEQFACPGCGQPVTMMTYNRPGTPYTSRFGEKG